MRFLLIAFLAGHALGSLLEIINQQQNIQR